MRCKLTAYEIKNILKKLGGSQPETSNAKPETPSCKPEPETSPQPDSIVTSAHLCAPPAEAHQSHLSYLSHSDEAPANRSIHGLAITHICNWRKGIADRPGLACFACPEFKI
jgi:hypothetical protein